MPCSFAEHLSINHYGKILQNFVAFFRLRYRLANPEILIYGKVKDLELPRWKSLKEKETPQLARDHKGCVSTAATESH